MTPDQDVPHRLRHPSSGDPHRSRDPRTQPRRGRCRPAGDSHPRRPSGQADRRSHDRDRAATSVPAGALDVGNVPRRSAAAAHGGAASDRDSRRRRHRQDRRARRRRPLQRPHHPRRHGRPRRSRPAPGRAIGGPGRPRPPRPADPRGLRGQERADRPRGRRAGDLDRDRRPDAVTTRTGGRGSDAPSAVHGGPEPRTRPWPSSTPPGNWRRSPTARSRSCPPCAAGRW